MVVKQQNMLMRVLRRIDRNTEEFIDIDNLDDLRKGDTFNSSYGRVIYQERTTDYNGRESIVLLHREFHCFDSPRIKKTLIPVSNVRIDSVEGMRVLRQRQATTEYIEEQSFLHNEYDLALKEVNL